MPTIQEQLDSVQTAIVDIETNGQEVEIDGMRYSSANLAVLYKREEALIHRLNRSSGNLFDRTRTGIPYRG